MCPSFEATHIKSWSRATHECVLLNTVLLTLLIGKHGVFIKLVCKIEMFIYLVLFYLCEQDMENEMPLTKLTVFVKKKVHRLFLSLRMFKNEFHT